MARTPKMTNEGTLDLVNQIKDLDKAFQRVVKQAADQYVGKYAFGYKSKKFFKIKKVASYRGEIIFFFGSTIPDESVNLSRLRLKDDYNIVNGTLIPKV